MAHTQRVVLERRCGRHTLGDGISCTGCALVPRLHPPSALTPARARRLSRSCARLFCARQPTWLTTAPSYLNALGGAIALPLPNATAFVHREALLNWVVDAHWARNESTPAGLAWARQVYAALAEGGFLGDAQPLPVYVNYADADLGASFPRAYYGANYERLQRLKAHVNPAGAFDFPQAVQLPRGG